MSSTLNSQIKIKEKETKSEINNQSGQMSKALQVYLSSKEEWKEVDIRLAQS